MSRQAREIKLMLEGSINNHEGHREQYQITNLESVLKAIGLLEQINLTTSDLHQYRIGHLVNNIRRKLSAERGDIKQRLRRLIQNWQRTAKENDQPTRETAPETNGTNGNRPDSRNAEERAEQLSERLHPTNTVENGEKKKRGRPKKSKKVEELKSRESPINYDLANSPSVIPRRESPVEMTSDLILPDLVKKKHFEVENDHLSRNLTPKREDVSDLSPKKPITERPPSLPVISQEREKPIEKRIANASTHNLNTQKINRKRPLETAIKKEEVKEEKIVKSPIANKISPEIDEPSTLERFVPSVSVFEEPYVPGTPNQDEIEKAANGDEWEGVSGVRDSRGNFHRWHDEISLEQEGTEPFLHILPYVDIDLELL